MDNKPMSLNQHISRAMVVVAVAVLFILCSFIFGITQTINLKERDQTVKSLGEILYSSIERPYTLGDFIGVESALDLDKMPKYVSKISVTDGSAIKIAESERDRVDSEFCRDHSMVKVVSGAIKNLEVSIVYSTCDIFSSAYNRLVYLLILFLIALVVGKSLVERSVRYALSPLTAAINEYASTPDSEKLVARAPIEIQPLFRGLNQLNLDLQNEKIKSSLTNMARRVAHDIRSPLSALRNVAVSDEDTVEKREMIHKITNRISKIADDLLEKSRAPFSEQRSTFGQMISDVVKEKKVEFRHLNFQVKDLSENARFTQNSTTIERILSNLINNAVEANAQKVDILVQIETNRMKIDLVDDGAGIAPSILSVLGRSAKSYNKRFGNGLGLSSARDSLIAMGGDLIIVSEQGAGTTVRLLLPYSK